MSYSRIIQLSEQPVPVEERIDDMSVCGNCSTFLDSHCDWYGDAVTDPEERRRDISLLAKNLEGIATVDAEKETLTILPGANDIFRKWYADTLHRLADAPNCDPELTVFDIEQFRGSKTILRVDTEKGGVGNYQSSAAFVHDAVFSYHPQTLHIGGIVEYHY